jgi:hypothetical protein
MIKAIIEEGVIRLLEPLPPTWVEGQELRVEAVGERVPTESADPWAQEMAALASRLDRPEEWADLEESLKDADAQAKAWMRGRMGLPE